MSVLGFTLPLIKAVAVVADRLMVAEAEAIRRWLMVWGGRWLSPPCDGSSLRPDLVRCLPRDLMNDTAVVDVRFSEAVEGIFIVRDLFGVDVEAGEI